MGLERRLQYDVDFAGFELAAPGKLGCLPGRTESIDLTTLDRQPRLRPALVPLDPFQRQVERRLEEFGNVRETRARADGRDFHRPFCGHPIVHGADAALAIEVAGSVVRPRDSEPGYFAA